MSRIGIIICVGLLLALILVAAVADQQGQKAGWILALGLLTIGVVAPLGYHFTNQSPKADPKTTCRRDWNL